MTTNSTPIRAALALLALSTFNPQLSTCFAQGSLTPPGAPAPTMKSLDQLDARLERRTPISSLPFSITNGGSYYFTTNLIGIGAISIDADNVTVDLNGFTLGGGPGSATGFFLSGVHSNLCIRNGTIANRGGVGVGASGAVNSQLLDLRVVGNGAGGVAIGANSQVNHCVVRDNTTHGVSAGDNCIIRECTSSGNTGRGITTGVNSQVSDCAAASNIDGGIVVGDNSSVHNCSSRANASGIITGLNCAVQHCQIGANLSTGIFANDSSRVLDSVATESGTIGIYVRRGCSVSGCVAARNSSSGIYVFLPGCIVQDNTCTGNNTSASSLHAGIFIDDSDNRVEGNHVSGNGYAGIQIASPYVRNVVIRNSVAGNGVNNYVDPGGNDFGPIGTAAAATSPWANISH